MKAFYHTSKDTSDLLKPMNVQVTLIVLWKQTNRSFLQMYVK